MRFRSSFAGFGLILSVLLPYAAFGQSIYGDTTLRASTERTEATANLAENRCCKCVHNEQNFCTRLTNIASCDAFKGSAQYGQLSPIQTNLLANFTCTDVTSTACDAPAAGTTPAPASDTTPTTPTTPPPSPPTPPTPPICPQTYPSLGEAAGGLDAAAGAQNAATPAEPPFVSITPDLGVSIPGLVFSPARKEGNLVYIPFLAQYIAAVERYMVGLAVLAAVVMVVYGGLRYLLGAAIQDVATGKKIIVDAIVGMMLALGAYFILSIINPNVLELPDIKLGYITPEEWGENLGAYPSATAGTTPCRCAPIPSEVNAARVLPVPCVYQWGGSWGNLAYGPNLLLPGEPVPSNLAQAVGKPACTGHVQNSSCVGTLGQGGCGAASLATVMGYYHATSKEGSPVTTVEAARYLIRAGYRPFNGGTTGICSSIFSTEFPGFTCQNGLRNPVHSAAGIQEIADELRAGHPIIFHCHECRVRNAVGREIVGAGAGHYMVLTGVSEDNRIFSVHDVGWGPDRGAIAVRADDILATTHVFNAPNHDGVMTVWHGNINIMAVIRPVDPARIPPGGSCQGRERRTPTAAGGNIIRIPFTYCPGGTCDGRLYRENEASIVMDSKWLTQPNVAFRVFMYIHGLNSGGTGESGAAKWRTVLANYPAESRTPILIIRPHNYGTSNNTLFQHLDAQEVLTAAMQALRSYPTGGAGSPTIGAFTIRDIAIGAHSSGICGGHFARASQLHYSYNGQSIPTRGLVAFDAYGQCSLDTPSLVNPTGLAYIADTDTQGMGVVGGRPFAATMAARLGMTGGADHATDCPTYARESGVTRCYVKAQTTSSNGYPASANGWTLFETALGHDPSVDRIAGYAFRAFYGN
jgi:hypothetical protein